MNYFCISLPRNAKKMRKNSTKFDLSHAKLNLCIDLFLNSLEQQIAWGIF